MREREGLYCTGDWGCITAALILYRECARFTAAAQLYCDRGATVLLARSSRTGSSAVHEARLYWKTRRLGNLAVNASEIARRVQAVRGAPPCRKLRCVQKRAVRKTRLRAVGFA